MPVKSQLGGYMDMSDKIVLCGANSYEQKYYFNKEQFGKLPEEIQDDLHVICVLFTEEVGGIFTICFDQAGNLQFETDVADNDYLFDKGKILHLFKFIIGFLKIEKYPLNDCHSGHFTTGLQL